MLLLLNNNCTTKTNKEHDIQQMFVCLSDSQKQENNIQPEINNATYQEEKIHNNPFPGAEMSPGSSLSKELNTVPNYSISGGHMFTKQSTSIK
jgi:hypothetical protein